MRRKAPEWECELWSYLSECDGTSCPLCGQCQIRLKGGWCISDHKEHLERLLDSTQFDPHNYDFVDHATPGRIFQLIEKLAQKYLKIAGIRCPPVPTELLTVLGKEEAIEVRELPLKVCDGAVWHTEDGWVIYLNAHNTTARQRYTLFHEAFHIASHGATAASSPRETKTRFFCELLADYFSSCVLMPRQWVMEKWAEVEDLDRMAEMFDVPVREMWVKLRTLNLVRHPIPSHKTFVGEQRPLENHSECAGPGRRFTSYS